VPTEDLQRLCLKRQGFSDTVIDVMMRARRASSNALYKTYLDKFCEFCCTQNIDPLTCSVPKALEFLSGLFDDSTHRGSSALGTARSALSSVIILPDNTKFGDDLYVKMFMKGVKAIRPSEPRYLESWNPDTILDMFKTFAWNPASELELLFLSMKLVMLILLSTYQRGQIILALNLDRMTKMNDEIVFRILASDVKQGSRPGFVPAPVRFKKYSIPELCVVSHIDAYLNATKELRGNVKQLMIISRKPFNAVSRDTVSRWVKDVMNRAGINVETFAPGSTRGASASGAFAAGVPLENIMAKAGWSRESTFVKWYKR